MNKKQHIFVWHNGSVLDDLVVKQVYGVLFTQDGRLLLKIDDIEGKKFYSLAGGKPEKFDKDYDATLRREVLEEVNSELEKDTFIVGYQVVNEPSGIPPYAQLRMTAIIKKIGQSQPDPDNGKTYQRILTSPKRAIKLLNWGKPGKKMIKEAVKIAKTKLGIKKFSKIEEYV